ncbi:MAG TPA: PAS domain S-box protein [Flavobacterium sp.]|jgi:PAS domain S-box-containing protein
MDQQNPASPSTGNQSPSSNGNLPAEGTKFLTKTGPLGAISAERLYYKMIDEVMDYAILLLDLEGNILNWNQGAANIKGYTAKEIIGTNFRVFYAAEDRKNGLPEKLLDDAIKFGKANHEGWRLKKDGSKFWGSIVITALHDDNGNVIAFSKVTRDLTQRKAAEEMLQRNAKDLEFKNDELRRSEERYHGMIAEIEDYAIILLDPDGKILNWNKGGEKIKGYKAEEVVGRNFNLFYLQEDIEAGLPQRLINQARTEGKASHEGWRVKKDGSTFWGSIVITALHDKSNNVSGFSKVTRDLTERKKSEERQERYAVELKYQNEMLRRSEERYHRMIAEVEDYAIILLDRNGNILNWNKGAEAIKGYKENEILGKNFSIFYLPEDRETVPKALLAEAVQNNKATHEGWRMRKDGTRFWGSIVITALHDDENRVTGFSKVTRDLTQKKQADDYILRQNKQLEEYAYVASHDLQEPLRKIIMFSDLLQHKLDDKEEMNTLAQKIAQSSGRMSNLINAVLQYSQVGSNGELRREVDLNETLTDIEVDFELLLQERNGKINRENLPVVFGIPIQMHQLFANLISNAIKFNTSDPEITITAKPLSRAGKSFTTITVSDNGIGFNEEYADKIFGMFHRLKDTTKGTGIGLALCKRIVESHGGTISATSEPGKGSTFVITLPVGD